MEPSEVGANLDAFRDCISVAVIEKLGHFPGQNVKTDRNSRRGKSGSVSKKGSTQYVPESTPAELAEFVDYIAEESFSALPAELRNLTYQTLREDKALAEAYATPLSSETVDRIANTLPPCIEDSLVTYRLISPPSTDLSSFLAPVVNAYIAAVTTPPPHPLTTRPSACEICDRDWITLTYHHLIPRAVHAKVRKRGWHPEHKLNDVAWLCRACHSFVHRVAGNEELAREWFTVERLVGREDVRRFAGWVGGVRWKKR